MSKDKRNVNMQCFRVDKRKIWIHELEIMNKLKQWTKQYESFIHSKYPTERCKAHFHHPANNKIRFF